MDKSLELILAVPTNKAIPISWRGLNSELLKGFEKIVRSSGKFKQRGIPGQKGLENDPKWKQIIPYMIFKYGDKYFLMQRGVGGHEKRLHNRYTLGIGGHINKEDLVRKSIIDWGVREFEEEIEYSGTLKATPIGLLNDDNDIVGQVHLGYVILLEGDSDQIKVKDELQSGKLVTLDEISQVYDQFETWSQMVFDHLKSPPGITNITRQPKLTLQTRGRFIVIEGTDGSGKGTQIQLLKQKLDGSNIPAQIIDFPRYEDNIYGKLVGRYLKGEFGGMEQVNPYLASLGYAGDRMLSKPLIESWLNDGQLVIANRYVLSNRAFMSARLPVEERQAYIEWLDDLEYIVHSLPKEELVIFLYVPGDLSVKNVDQKMARNYLNGEKRDIHESSANYQNEVAKMYLQFAKTYPNWVIIECTENGVMKSREEIHGLILKTLIEKGILK